MKQCHLIFIRAQKTSNTLCVPVPCIRRVRQNLFIQNIKKNTERFYSVNASYIKRDKVLTCLNGGKCFVWFLNQKIMFSPYFSVWFYALHGSVFAILWKLMVATDTYYTYIQTCATRSVCIICFCVFLCERKY